MEINVEEFYKTYGPMVLRRCRSILGDEDRALDAMQEVFVNLINNKDSLKGTYPSSLLYTMATNVCLNLIRSEKRKPITQDDEILQMIASSEDVEDTAILRDMIDYIFKKEKSSTREIAVMHYVDRMTLEEVAETVGMSVSGVRKRLRQLREKVHTMGGIAWKDIFLILFLNATS